jgi:hypothetical protein
MFLTVNILLLKLLNLLFLYTANWKLILITNINIMLLNCLRIKYAVMNMFRIISFAFKQKIGNNKVNDLKY